MQNESISNQAHLTNDWSCSRLHLDSMKMRCQQLQESPRTQSQLCVYSTCDSVFKVMTTTKSDTSFPSLLIIMCALYDLFILFGVMYYIYFIVIFVDVRNRIIAVPCYIYKYRRYIYRRYIYRGPEITRFRTGTNSSIHPVLYIHIYSTIVP